MSTNKDFIYIVDLGLIQKKKTNLLFFFTQIYIVPVTKHLYFAGQPKYNTAQIGLSSSATSNGQKFSVSGKESSDGSVVRCWLTDHEVVAYWSRGCSFPCGWEMFTQTIQ